MLQRLALCFGNTQPGGRAIQSLAGLRVSPGLLYEARILARQVITKAEQCRRYGVSLECHPKIELHAPLIEVTPQVLSRCNLSESSEVFHRTVRVQHQVGDVGTR